MKELFYFILLFLQLNKAISQNLIENGDFELHVNCTGAFNDLIDWYSPSGGTPDYFNGCGTNSCCSVPNNYTGFQQDAEGGNAYVGLFFFHEVVANAREYVQTHLTKSLTLNKHYIIKFNLSLSDSSRYYIGNNFCIALSQNQLSSTGYNIISFIPQICIDSSIHLNDDKQWLSITSIYSSQGGEEYLTVGNFQNDNNTDTVRRIGNFPDPAAYYYIDNFYFIPIPEIEAGPDVQISQGNNTQFNATIENGWNGLQYRWRPSVALSDSTILNPIASPSQTTTYYLHLIDTSGTASFVDTIIDSLKVTVVPNGINEINLKNALSIYPNPSKDLIKIQGLPAGIKEVDIYSIDGKITSLPLLWSRTHGSIEGEVNIQSLSDGIYFLKVRTNKSVYNGRFVKQ